MLAEGIGTSADHAQAMVWLERAAANGNLDAGLLLERMRAKQAADPAAD
jgi:TPR repeat protein